MKSSMQWKHAQPPHQKEMEGPSICRQGNGYHLLQPPWTLVCMIFKSSRPLKKALEGHQFQSDNEVQQAVQN
jgi:hypothetical protein